MKNKNSMLVFGLVSMALAFSVMGCSKPVGEHPEGEHPASDQPKSEHPEHPK